MTRRRRVEDLTSFAVPEQPALSPDGSQAVYVLRTADAEADRDNRALWRVTADGRARQLTRGHADSAPAWSPDGTGIAFLRAQDGPPQVWLLPSGGGEPERLTSSPLGAGPPVWSPDGTRIAFTAPVDPHGPARPAAPLVADRLDYQADGAGPLGTRREHLHVLDLATGRCRQVTEGDWRAGAPSWSPDGAKLAFAAATAPDADLVSSAPAHVVDVTGPLTTPIPVGPAEHVTDAVTWTADGSALLVVARTAGPVGHARLLRLPLDGGDPVDLAGPLDRNVMPGGPGYPGGVPRLTDDGRAVLFCVRDRGCTHLYSAPVDGGAPTALVTGAGRTVSGLSVAGGSAVVVLGTPTSFGRVVRVDPATGAETTLAVHDDDAEPFPCEEREFTIGDGTVVHGWLIRDPSFEGPRPLLLDIHGGPHNAWSGTADEARLYQQELVALGWVVLLLNPRGSDGYGEAFYNAALGAWGTADARDFLEPLDQLVAEGLADPRRLAVAGYSYGGYMTCYLTSRDDRFAAAVAGGAVTDLTSMVGTSDGGRFISEHELGGRPWTGDPDYGGMSPMARVDRVRTPTLVLHGQEDLRCPVGQAQQWHTALRELGVPTRLVLYPGSSHLFVLNGPPSHRIDFNRRVVDWVRQYAGSASGPRRPRLDAAHWQRRLTALAQRHGVPGAVLGVLRVRPDGEDELVEAAHGVLNRATGVAATTDSLFQLGSITKVWTATVVMRLVDQGRLDLDAPVADVLPELRLADPEVAARVTARHLLTHTSGIDGDVFTDTGRGDDCLERYVAELAEVAQNHPLGVTWSYCNSGFSLLGRVVERLTGGTWDAALRELLLAPLGLRRTVTLPEQALLHRAAVGHFGAPEAVPAEVWGLPRALGPAGLISSTAADVLAFARLHLTGGLGPDGDRLLGEDSAAAMAAAQVDLPSGHLIADSWGLGWCRTEWDGRRLVGHDGSTIGQSAYLRLLPEEGLAVVLLTNSDSARPLYEDLYREIFAELAGVTMPNRLAPPADPVPVDLDDVVGTYERTAQRLEVLEGGVLRSTITGALAELLPEPPMEYELVALEENVFVVWEPQHSSWVPVVFYRLPTGERYLHFSSRATPKVS
ncbi:dipeptidyl aminopeptidase/acylaminoacyl peptidase/CubicO group peptidase (beta-lactamase class C family) [Saccharothrix coeruleofusca]|uniref:serine hydrolase n=1 Tax=Saccharothrix coeruleofusca TaxID=33919 RepID=UPI001AE23AB3|nr:serine hydrolase [Saccharothrix coeruleofusca]MBP2335440.1 dipeptidyl aminopeptidase/acylaminoacyl peptidase/CubicO group peptidase (beta-lactamase class C family) [Saccharothrix coeruleofusca]